MEKIKPKPANGTAAKPAAPAGVGPFLEEIKKRAYEIYAAGGSKPGNDMYNWLQAEKEIKRKYKIQ